MKDKKTMKIVIIFAVAALLFGIAYWKNYSGEKIQESASNPPSAEQTEPAPKEGDVQSETATVEQSPKTKGSDSEQYVEALKNDLPTLLEFKTSA